MAQTETGPSPLMRLWGNLFNEHFYPEGQGRRITIRDSIYCEALSRAALLDIGLHPKGVGLVFGLLFEKEEQSAEPINYEDGSLFEEVVDRRVFPPDIDPNIISRHIRAARIFFEPKDR